MKKAIFIVSLCLVLTLSACTNNNNEENSSNANVTSLNSSTDVGCNLSIKSISDQDKTISSS